MGPNPKRHNPRGTSNTGDTAAEIDIASLSDLHPPGAGQSGRVCVLELVGGGMPDRL